MTQEQLEQAIDTIKDLLNGGTEGYVLLVKLAEAQKFTLSQFDKFVQILEAVSDSLE